MKDTVNETIDSKLKERLAANAYQRYLREPQRQPLQHALTERELNGENLTGAPRVYAAAPKNVSAELKDTALAEADQRQAAVEAKAQGDEATAKALHSLADLLGTQKAALEADHAKHENWSAQTAGLREEGGKARVELTRRGQAPEPMPGEATLEWWQRFERGCQAFEKHLVDLEAQAETEGGPWPPQPTAEHQVAPEVEQSNEPDLDTAWSAEIRDEPSYEPEPEMPEATAEI